MNFNNVSVTAKLLTVSRCFVFRVCCGTVQDRVRCRALVLTVLKLRSRVLL